MLRHAQEELRRGPARALLASGLMLSLTLGAPAGAVSDTSPQVTVAGVKLPTEIDTPQGALRLNGAGLRRRLLARVYVASLYTPHKVTTFEAAADPKLPHRLHFIFQREVSRKEFSDVIVRAISSTSTPLEVAQAGVGIARLGEMVNVKKSLKPGDTLSIDWIPDQGTQIVINGKAEGPPIPDAALNLALLRIFLGGRPVDAGLKNELLGQMNAESEPATP